MRKMENKTHEEASIINVSSLTCIDLANPNFHQSAASLKQACQDCGFFYVTNHGISEELRENAFAQSKKFFALPLEEKLKVLRNEKHQGYSPVLSQMSDNQIHGDFKESFFIGIEGSIDGGLHSHIPFCRPNIWPNPDVLPGWRDTMEKYHQEALRVCKAIARVLALALNVEEDYFDKPEMLRNPLAFMRLIHYEGMSDPSKGIYGCGPHSDFGMMTLLATDNVMGLQICKDKEVQPRKWEYVPPIKDAYIVNIGDLLERWSNGIFKSTLHRVLGNGQDRYSIALFLQPCHDCLVECLPTCQSENSPPKYQAIKCSTYLTQRYQESQVDLSINQKQT
ncbi:PREDICTED: 2-oxoglutarate-dependent dioxygenase tropC-like isoform X1 [Camelina sativa]|uniref:2-oxoglutarate-dependent dioxygenase tropC-like isoform X1 n=1 Tax=Camelina sativa TaxID=90675 RepID=A0ABM0ZFD1_CAMSA|nr:PREDICTED: 2-oxoglutarate-dependent dioxygenase tropC-like isoform X1 [Camelina sativa]